MSLTHRLTALGLVLPPPPTPAGSYLPALRRGNTVYTSGQVAMRDGSLIATGKVGGGEVDQQTAADCARQCALNALAAIGTVAELDQITRIVKVLVFVASAPDFTAQPQVANAASDLFIELFGDAGRHVRSAVGVAVLPLDSPVEVELVAELG